MMAGPMLPLTGEIKKPKRNVPRAIIGGVGIAMTLYVLLNYAYMKVFALPPTSGGAGFK